MAIQLTGSLAPPGADTEVPASFGLVISVRRVVVGLFLVWLVIWGMSVLQAFILTYASNGDRIWLLDVDSEDSFYTWFSTMLLVLAGGLALLLSKGPDGTLPWRVIAAILCAMSIDEMLSLHEKLNEIVGGRIDASGAFLFAWVIPALVAAVVVAAVLLPFVLRLPRRVAVLIIVSGVIFIAGAIGVEMVTGVFLGGESEVSAITVTGTYRALTNIEEGLECIGVLVLISGLLLRCSQVFPDVFVDPLWNRRDGTGHRS